MTSGLFRSTLDARTDRRPSRFSALPLSVAVHVFLVLAAVVIPLLATDVLPRIPTGREEWVAAATLPSPPPAPGALARRAQAAPIEHGGTVVPMQAPNGVRDSGLERPAAAPLDDHFQAGVVDGGVEDGRGLAPVLDPPPPPAPVTKPVRPGASLKPPIKMVDVQPIYPEAARQAKVEGVVIIEAVIGPTGDVQEARVLRSRPLLDEAALAAVRQWKFTPSLLNGVPVPVVMTVTVNFTLR